MRRKRLRKPRGLARLLWRSPIMLYKLGLGGLMGERLLLLTHVGRVSFEDRKTVIEIVAKDEEKEAYYVVSAWGERADWLRNVQHNPRCTIQVGTRCIKARAELVSKDEAESVLMDYASRHPRALRSLAAFSGFEVDGSEQDYRKMARQLPTVVFVPSSENSETKGKPASLG